MTIWIVTIGSSDVQLLPKNSWQKLFRTARSEIGNLQFEPRQLEPDPRKPSLVPSRVMGMVYGEQGLDELVFPLLDNFRSRVRLVADDWIVVLLTDQSQVFEGTQFRQDKTSAYWQDTCALEPILERYFKHHYPKVETSYLLLKPTVEKSGLDDWNDVLGLVQEQFKEILADAGETVYVSHQAGTPAISSAVQFSSLAQFGDRVQFLVSNEFDASRTKTIKSSSYLFNLQKNEALKLLTRYDYAGVKEILDKYLNAEIPEQKRIQKLLEASIEWNHAKFQKFKKCLDKGKLLEIKDFPWWRSGYESAYLAWVRLEQGNTVEGLFHSFRAVEGSVISWCRSEFRDHLQENPTYGTQLRRSILEILPDYEREEVSPPNQDKWRRYQGLGLFGDPLYGLLRQAKPEWKTHPYIEIVWNSAKGKRNDTFHKIEGLTEKDVFDAWQATDIAGWMTCMVSCLNFISGQDFKSLEEASLQAQVHRQLLGAIDRYQPLK